MLKGEKVLLRPIQKSDIPIFVRWINDQEINQFTNKDLPVTELSEEQWFEKAATKTDGAVLAIETIEDGDSKIIGNCGIYSIHMVHRRATFAICIGEKEYWGKGYGSEAGRLIIRYAFNRLNLNRICSSVLNINPRSLALHKKLGFKEEGARRQNYYKNGSYCDEIIFGLLRTEWERMRTK